MKKIFATLALALAATSATADIDTSYLPANTDLSSFTAAEIGVMASIIHSSDSRGEKMALLQSYINRDSGKDLSAAKEELMDAMRYSEDSRSELEARLRSFALMGENRDLTNAKKAHIAAAEHFGDKESERQPLIRKLKEDIQHQGMTAAKPVATPAPAQAMAPARATGGFATPSRVNRAIW